MIDHFDNAMEEQLYRTVEEQLMSDADEPKYALDEDFDPDDDDDFDEIGDGMSDAEADEDLMHNCGWGDDDSY